MPCQYKKNTFYLTTLETFVSSDVKGYQTFVVNSNLVCVYETHVCLKSEDSLSIARSFIEDQFDDCNIIVQMS